MKFTKPKKLRKGDTVAVISASWGGPSVFPHIYEKGIKNLSEKFGLKVKEYPTTRMDAEKLKKCPQLRAKDVDSAFRDKEIKAIFSSIGGDDSIRILPYLDIKTIKKNPKIIMGYSDTVTLLTYLNTQGMVTFHGPAIMAGFSQLENFPACEKHIKKILFENPSTYQYKPYKTWANNYLDWSQKKNIGKTSKINKNEGWHWLQGNRVVKGKLFGGCIEVLEMIERTKFWPSSTFWNGKILFIETSEDKPSAEYVKVVLRKYGKMGIFNRITGVLVGRARDYNKKETKELENYLISIIADEFNHPEMPIIANMDFGHTDPQFILTLGVEVEINCKKKTFRLMESSLKD